MGCFLGCFGLSNKRKRSRKTLYRVLAQHQKFGRNYEAVAITEKSVVPYQNFGDEYKEKKTGVKKKKKVSFNLNVQIYEPDPTAYQILENEEEENGNITAALEREENEYPSNHRYYNCMYEEDERAYEESDIDDYDDDDEFDDDDDSDEILENDEVEVFDPITRQKELSEACYSSVAEGRSIYKRSVLSPVENLTQWKEIKAKVAPTKHMRKENVPLVQKTSVQTLHFSPCNLESNVLQSKPLLPEIAVDASLSNWLVSPNYDISKATIHCQ